MQIQRTLGFLLVFLACLNLAACKSSLEEPSFVFQDKLKRLPPSAKNPTELGDYAMGLADTETGNPGFESFGNDTLVGSPVRVRSKPQDDAADIKLNLVDAPVAAAAKVVLGDILGLNYVIDARVQGTVTIQTADGVSKSALLALFQEAIGGLGATIARKGESYVVLPIDVAKQAMPNLQSSDDDPLAPGQRSKVIQLNYVSASDVAEVLAPLLTPEAGMRVDRNRNALVLRGSGQELAALRETISVFDVDWMKGMSFALVPVRSSQPTAIANDLRQIYNLENGPLRDVLKFVPNKRLKSVLIISARGKYIREAKNWINKLDVLAEGNEASLHVYKVQNRTATELARVLRSVLASEGKSGGTAVDTYEKVAPKLASAALADDESAQVPSGPETPPTGLGSDEDVRRELAEVTFGTNTDDQTNAPQIRVVADDANNSLLIFATSAEFERMKDVLQEVDSMPNQVLLEAVIAEVSLDDEMKFGVRWLIGKDNHHGTFSDVVSGAVASSFPGFSYFLKANDIGFTLNALSSVTDVRVLSSPSLLVLDNKSAVLQVGDQVPIVSQQVKSTTTGEAPIVNAVELKDTGVILKVTPRVNDSGRVILDIEQEVSSVVKTTTSGIDSPTIRQRRIRTSVALTDGEAMALGGMIQEKETTGQAKVPVLGDVPILKNAFRHKTNGIGRTELIIFIRPRVVRNTEEARAITQEFREGLDVQAPRVRREEPSAKGEFLRIIN